jgi:hypothetical protein
MQIMQWTWCLRSRCENRLLFIPQHFLPSSHFIPLRRLLASAPQTIQSSFSHRDRLFSELQLRRQTPDRSISPRYYCSDTCGSPYGYLPHSGSYPRCTIAHAPSTLRSLHEFRSGTSTIVPFLFHPLKLILSTVVIEPCSFTTPIKHAARRAIVAVACVGLRTQSPTPAEATLLGSESTLNDAPSVVT